jgi:hypothetical protein
VLYRLVLRQKLHTYTSCFRVFRRSAAAGIQLRDGGFIGVAETLGRLDLNGSRIVEYPATLEVRLIGRSKMKILVAIVGHAGLLLRLLRLRARASFKPKIAAPVPAANEASGRDDA